jgi:hypothetical protein
MKRTLTIAITAALGATASTAAAVMLNPRGTGQVLIYPYFTVNHQQTLVSVINTTEHGKALKIRFREAYDGRDVANFNVYLGPYDSWVGAVYDTSEDGTGAAAVATNDASCTVPGFIGFGTPVPGLPAAPWHSATRTTARATTVLQRALTPGRPTSHVRARVFSKSSKWARSSIKRVAVRRRSKRSRPGQRHASGCEQVRDAWDPGGYWTTNAMTDLLPPAGGLYGAAGIVDVAQGTLYSFDAVGIDGFSDIAQHTGPNNARPNLGGAVTDSAHSIATAYVPMGNVMVRADYPAATQAIDAVSAVLMADTLYNEFDAEPALGAATDWVVTFPTKQFYSDPGILGPTQQYALPPFETVYSGGAACNGLSAKPYDRAGTPSTYVGCGFICPASTGPYLCFEATVITFNGSSGETSKALGSRVSPQSLDRPATQRF